MATRPDLDDIQMHGVQGMRIPRRPVPVLTRDEYTPLRDDDKVVLPINRQYSDKVIYHHVEPEHQKNQPYHHIESEPREHRIHRNPWGLSPIVFASLVALTTAIVVGAVVGGGVSTTKRDCSVSRTTSNNGSSGSSDCPSTTATLPVTPASSPTGVLKNYVPVPPSQVESLANNCSRINGTSITSAQGSSFEIICPLAIDGSYGPDGITVGAVVAYTLQDCVNACTGMNLWKQYHLCNSVTWDSGMAGIVNFIGANCWLFRNGSASHGKENSTSAWLRSA